MSRKVRRAEKMKKKKEKRRARIQKNGFWGKYYRYKDRKHGKKMFKEACMYPIDPNLIVFEAFKGKHCACSPKALFEEVLQNPAYAGYRLVWSLTELDKYRSLVNDNPRVSLVKRGSKLYYEALAKAKYRITNSISPITVPRREGQVYIQTWHGTPLKRLGCDIARDGNDAQSLREIHESYRTEADQFTYLLSPSEYTSEKLASAFALTEEEKKNKIIELGYPRNVHLFTYTAKEVEQLKKFYGVPKGKKVILYAPTFRETSYQYGVGFEQKVALDMERLRARFGDTACVLMRTHYFAVTDFDYSKYEGFIIKGAEVADINRLYIISDILVTDYSSVMFDFSILRRPMIFYMYDWEEYRGQLRDFYIEPDILPGPIVTTQDELEEEIEKVLTQPFVCDEKYQAFCDKFTYLDDADAAKRVLEATVAPLSEEVPVPEMEERYRKRLERKNAYKHRKTQLENGMLAQLRYPKYLRKPISEKSILLEAKQGKAMDGNILALLFELVNGAAYKEYELYLSVTAGNREMFRERLQNWGLDQVQLLVRRSRHYFKMLATSKYLVNDSAFADYFIKRPEQIYLNTWTGTSIRAVSKSEGGKNKVSANQQENLLAADYLMFPNEFSMHKILDDYMVKNLGTGEIWLTGNPKNESLFNEEKRAELRKMYEMEGKRVYAYWPAKRDAKSDFPLKEQMRQLGNYCKKIDAGLPDDVLIYVNLQGDYCPALANRSLSHFRLFPKGCKTYDLLNAADGLITDYTGLFVDFAATRKKIILFNYDEKRYMSSREFSISFDELPFPKARTAEELLRIIKEDKAYDDSTFWNTFCPYERPDAAKAVCHKLLFGTDENIKTCSFPENGKENVVVFGGMLQENNVTDAFYQWLSKQNKEQCNYTVLYKTEDFKQNQEALDALPEGVRLLGVTNGLSLSLTEKLLYKIWTKRGIVPYFLMERILSKMAKLDSVRIFGKAKIDKLIHFTGYSNDFTTIFRGLSCKKVIYVHNDMEREAKKRHMIRSEVLTRAYQEYDEIVITNEKFRESVNRLTKALPKRKK